MFVREGDDRYNALHKPQTRLVPTILRTGAAGLTVPLFPHRLRRGEADRRCSAVKAAGTRGGPSRGTGGGRGRRRRRTAVFLERALLRLCTCAGFFSFFEIGVSCILRPEKLDQTTARTRLRQPRTRRRDHQRVCARQHRTAATHHNDAPDATGGAHTECPASLGSGEGDERTSTITSCFCVSAGLCQIFLFSGLIALVAYLVVTAAGFLS